MKITRSYIYDLWAQLWTLEHNSGSSQAHRHARMVAFSECRARYVAWSRMLYDGQELLSSFIIVIIIVRMNETL